MVFHSSFNDQFWSVSRLSVLFDMHGSSIAACGTPEGLVGTLVGLVDLLQQEFPCAGRLPECECEICTSLCIAENCRHSK